MELILLSAPRNREQQTWSILVGSTAVVGRGEHVMISVPEDEFLSLEHFSIEWKEGICYLTDLESRNGTLLNGKVVRHAELRTSDRIHAGQSQFLVLIPSIPLTKRPALKQILFQGSQVFGLVDSAIQTGLFDRLVRSGQEYQSLYEGEQGAQLAAFSPCLVKLKETDSFAEYLISDGWGLAWCTYLSSPQSLATVRHHLRRFLTVQLAGGQKMYFRFYDPRILRQFLPTCSPEQATEFFGPIDSYLVEGDVPQKIVRFGHLGGQVTREEVTVG